MKHRVHTFSLNIETAPPSSLKKKILDNLCDYANEFASFAGYDSRVKLNRLADSITVYGENCESINAVGAISIQNTLLCHNLSVNAFFY